MRFVVRIKAFLKKQSHHCSKNKGFKELFFIKKRFYKGGQIVPYIYLSRFHRIVYGRNFSKKSYNVTLNSFLKMDLFLTQTKRSTAYVFLPLRSKIYFPKRRSSSVAVLPGSVIRWLFMEIPPPSISLRAWPLDGQSFP